MPIICNMNTLLSQGTQLLKFTKRKVIFALNLFVLSNSYPGNAAFVTDQIKFVRQGLKFKN